jgi:pilus assembly protein FimV
MRRVLERVLRRPFATCESRASGAALVALASMLIAGPLHALTLGTERVTSYYGQTLRVEIPITAASGEQWSASCFKLVAPSRRDGAANLRQGVIDVSADGQRLVVRSPLPVEDLAVRFAIDVGCEIPLRREYTVLLDLAPVSLASSSDNPAVASAFAASAAKPSSAGKTDAPATAARDRVAKTRRAQRASNDSASGSSPSSVRAPRERGPRSTESRLVLRGSDRTNIDDASLAALAVPRLRISGDLPAWAASESGALASTGAPGAPVDELAAAIAKEKRARLAAAPIEEDLPARLEADLVVAKKRLAELQLQLNAATPKDIGANAPSDSASTLNKKPAIARNNEALVEEATKQNGFAWRSWIWIPALPVIAGLLIFLWRQLSAQRRRRAWSAADAATVVRAERDETSRFASESESFDHFERSHETSPPTMSDRTTSNATIGESSRQLENPLFHPNQTASSVDVGVLSQVTDEAQVYADLGRTNEAIEILAHHIDTSEAERPSPAPWLMLFELFRKSNRREDYDRLAPMFRKNFNGRLPEWDSYGDELALDDGLESFPHLIARIERDWGTPTARVMLDELLYDNRGGSRLGFSLAAYRDLLLLLQLHDQMANDGQLEAARPSESPGANDEDGTPKWDIALDMIEPPKPGELDDFLKGRKPG